MNVVPGRLLPQWRFRRMLNTHLASTGPEGLFSEAEADIIGERLAVIRLTAAPLQLA
jgi:hypothetical protein